MLRKLFQQVHRHHRSEHGLLSHKTAGLLKYQKPALFLSFHRTISNHAPDVAEAIPRWPRAFQLYLPAGATVESPHQFSYTFFQGPNAREVELQYSDNLASSERIAQSFLEEEVVGFDMEWIFPQPNPSPPLKELICLIQIASESNIGLFHIAVHEGDTVDELIAPSLRRIIESPRIRKIGQSIMGDGSRIKDHFGLAPQNLVELSYLHRLIRARTPRGRDRLKTYYVKGGLAYMVQTHFPGLRLMKDKGMHAGWMEPLSEKHRMYAADDAYASVMLFHKMNSLRQEMTPSPPLPRQTEEYNEWNSGFPVPKLIQLEPLTPTAENLSAKKFFLLHETGLRGVFRRLAFAVSSVWTGEK
ncbi:ribonuclease H-like protein [Massarina eburnea CBS 473.64]|uniref:Ribonuclease H-like protein n=1 Tax=Massarina eburnea CBS 473.64 TaxID=1395130 RepID=A0A6A6S7J7_9PLEO|nr:ribonuclease H-like protein [Massarina eburnea CBS 473.64]